MAQKSHTARQLMEWRPEDRDQIPEDRPRDRTTKGKGKEATRRTVHLERLPMVTALGIRSGGEGEPAGTRSSKSSRKAGQWPRHAGGIEKWVDLRNMRKTELN